MIMTEALLQWFAANKRALPWRTTTEPYFIWLSEIMAQQTRIAALLPYYVRFTERFPDVFALARAEEADVLKCWEGLGYYSRARLLHRTARIVAGAYGGVFPQTAAELQKLPGIGEYTAGAIASICYQEKIPAVDGNVLRVFARLRNDYADVSLPETKKALTSFLVPVMPEDAGAFNQALMELGALICVPGKPRCGDCPVAAFCEARKAGQEVELPVKAKKAPRKCLDITVLLVVNARGEILVRRRTERLLQGMWEYLLAEGKQEPARVLADWGMECASVEPLGSTVHIFTHLEWHMTGYRCRTNASDAPEGYAFVPLPVLNELALPSALSFFTKQC